LSDVYAFGILLYELFSGKSAFEGKPTAWIVDHVVRKRQQPVFPAATLRPVVQLASRCMLLEEEHRPSFHEVKAILRELVLKHTHDPPPSLASRQARPRERRRATYTEGVGCGSSPAALPGGGLGLGLGLGLERRPVSCDGRELPTACGSRPLSAAERLLSLRSGNDLRPRRSDPLPQLSCSPGGAATSGDDIRNLQLGNNTAPVRREPNAPARLGVEVSRHFEFPHRSSAFGSSSLRGRSRGLSKFRGGQRRPDVLTKTSITEEPDLELDAQAGSCSDSRLPPTATPAMADVEAPKNLFSRRSSIMRHTIS
jgi:hypothetical protein